MSGFFHSQRAWLLLHHREETEGDHLLRIHTGKASCQVSERKFSEKFFGIRQYLYQNKNQPQTKRLQVVLYEIHQPTYGKQHPGAEQRLLAERDQIAPVTTPELFERLWRGSMPGLISGATPDRNVFYSSYLSTCVGRDVRELSGSMDALKFNRFVTAVAARCSQLLNYNALAEDADIDIQTSKAWINILETLGIIFLLYPYSNNVLKRTIKTPKVYFYDTGLVCYLTRWSSPEVAESGAMSGALLENYTVSEIVKSYQNAGSEPYLYFYRDRDAKEIDVILEGDGRLCPLEIKKTATPDKRLTRVFKVIDKSPLQLGTGAVLCMADKFSAFDRDNLIVPIWMI